MSRHQNAAQNYSLLTDNKLFQNVAKFNYFGITVRDRNSIH